MRLVLFVSLALVSCVHVNTVHEARPVASKDPGLGPEETVPALPPASACSDAKVLTLEQVARGEGAGQRIAIDVVPVAQTICTLKACIGGNGCCNACGGQYIARLDDKLLVSLEKVGGCSGMDCNLHCEPFGRKPTRQYRFVGMNAFLPVPESQAMYAKSTLTVEKVCLLP